MNGAPGANARSDHDQVFERHLGMAAAEVEADWASWLQEEFAL